MNRSIFWKLLLVFVMSSIFVQLMIVFGIRQVTQPHRHDRDMIGHQLSLYVDQLAEDLGSPPRREAIDEMVRTKDLDVRIEGPGFSFVTRDGLPTLDTLRRNSHHFPKPGPISIIDGVSYFETKRGPLQYFFFPKDGTIEEPPHGIHVFILVVSVSLVLLVMYLVIRWVLRPLKWLMEGLSSVGAGQMDVVVPTRGKDELAQLGRAFNTMVHQVREMVATRERLLIDVSHELRSPLARLKVAAELLAEEKGRLRIRNTVVEMESLVTRLLDTARFASGNVPIARESFDLQALIAEIVRSLENQRPGIKIRQKDEAASTCLLDSVGMRSVITNLLENAIKYSKENSAPIEVDWDITSDEVRLRIQDFGVGISETELERVFEPFYRVEKSRSKETGGFGLGLSLCKRIVTAHRGTISLTSQVGVGTLVEVRIPLFLFCKVSLRPAVIC